MLVFSSFPFGKPIRLKNSPRKKSTVQVEPGKPNPNHCNELGANAMVSQFLTVKSNYRKDLQELVASDHHALRYFCFDDCSFIFDISHMKALINAIEDPRNEGKGGCVVLFQGLRKTSGEDKNKPQQNCSFGRPTIIALPYVISGSDTLKHVQIEQRHIPDFVADGTTDPPYDGYEHPGNGNSGQPAPITSAKLEAEKTFKVVTPGGEDDDTDWVISDEFKVLIDEWV